MYRLHVCFTVVMKAVAVINHFPSIASGDGCCKVWRGDESEEVGLKMRQ